MLVWDARQTGGERGERKEGATEGWIKGRKGDEPHLRGWAEPGTGVSGCRPNLVAERCGCCSVPHALCWANVGAAVRPQLLRRCVSHPVCPACRHEVRYNHRLRLMPQQHLHSAGGGRDTPGQRLGGAAWGRQVGLALRTALPQGGCGGREGRVHGGRGAASSRLPSGGAAACTARAARAVPAQRRNACQRWGSSWAKSRAAAPFASATCGRGQAGGGRPGEREKKTGCRLN